MKHSMKKLLALFVCVCLLMSGTAYAQEDGTEQNGDTPAGGVEINETNFPDKYFCGYVERFDKDGDGALSEEELKGVDEIDVMGQGVSDLKGIEYFTSLTSLNCFENELTSLDVRANTKLQVLCCGGNQLTSLDVRANVELTELDCSCNELTSLDVSTNTKLIGLSCCSNKLAALDVKVNTALTDLDCGGNELTSLDVSANTKLQTLYCYTNKLAALDVKVNTALTDLDCGDNQLTSLDVTNNPKLAGLYCGDNQLEELDLSNNADLSGFHCYNNKLRELDLSENVNLSALDCSGNQLTSLDVTACPGLYYLNAKPLEKKDIEYSGEPDTFNYGGGPTITVMTDEDKIRVRTGGINAMKIDSGNDGGVSVFEGTVSDAHRQSIQALANKSGGTLLKIYDVSMKFQKVQNYVPTEERLITEDFGKLTVSFYVGENHSGESVTAYQLHGADNAVITHGSLKVNENGWVTIDVTKLSVFGLVSDVANGTRNNNPANNDANNGGNAGNTNSGNVGNKANNSDNTTNNAPQTGDSANMTVWVALMMLTMTIIPIVAILGRRQKR